MKHIFIVNGAANKEKRQHLLAAIRHTYKNEDYEIEITEYPRHATKIAQRYAKTNEPLRIYSCGGDGTLHEIINGIYQYHHVQIAIIPIGTGNDFVKSLGYGPNDFSDLEKYLNPLFVVSDLIQTGEEVSINTVSLGFDVVIAKNVEKFKHMPIPKGTVPYYLALLYSMATSLTSPFKLMIDKQKSFDQPYTFVVVSNGQYYGGGYRPCPQARIDDGYLDYCLISSIPRHKILALSNKYKKGTHITYQKYVKTGRIETMQILNVNPVTINLDGEVRTMNQPTIAILKQQVTICLPHKQV